MHDPLSSMDYIAGSTIIQFTDTDPACLTADAVVEEQDTSLVLGKSPVIMDSIESFPELVQRMERQRREEPGSIIIRHASPWRFIAIVYDIDQEAISNLAWVEQALRQVLEECAQYHIEILAMPLLGTTYGKLEQEVVIQLLQSLLIQYRPETLKKILIYEI